MALLTVVRGVRTGHQFLLGEGKRRIGRESHCEIHLSDSETSRNHAEIELIDGQYRIRDLGSSNGTFVNDVRIDEQELQSGDRVQIGKQVLLFFRRQKSKSTGIDAEVDIVTSSADDASQIVGRLFAGSPIADQTEDWRADHLITQSASNQDAVERTNEVGSKSLWEILYRTSLAVSRTMDIDQLLRQILELIFQWVQCDRGCIMLLDADTGELRPSCRKNRKSVQRRRMAISKTILDYVTRQGEGVLTSDARDDARWSSSASISDGGIREAICVPMKGRYGVVGIIYIDTTTSVGSLASSPDRIFNEDHLKLLVAIGHQAALAIEDTNFYQNMVQAERLAIMGQTIATLSHHVKNIVQGLKGGGYLVDEGIKRSDWDTLQKGWRICERNQERIETLVLDMLTMSKDRMPVRTEVDLRNLVDDIAELVSIRAADQHTVLDWIPPAQFPVLPLDPEALHRAILNLVGNALDACRDRENGRVEIRLVDYQDYVVVSVRDNGVGIPEADLERIFSLFESTKGNRGTGLGLPVSLKIVQEHGGGINVHSQVGEGTVFEIRIPKVTIASISSSSSNTMS